jgi:DNA-binding CsgD family transcriptional regulator
VRGTPGGLADLTPCEREVLALVADGLSDEELAERLVITRTTAKTHVSRILGKLGLRHRAQLLAVAYESGLVRVAGHRLEPARGELAPVIHIGRAHCARRRAHLHPVAV